MAERRRQAEREWDEGPDQVLIPEGSSGNSVMGRINGRPVSVRVAVSGEPGVPRDLYVMGLQNQLSGKPNVTGTVMYTGTNEDNGRTMLAAGSTFWHADGWLTPTDAVGQVVRKLRTQAAESQVTESELVDDLLAREVRGAYRRLAPNGEPVTRESLREQINRSFPRGSRAGSHTDRMIDQMAERGDIQLDTSRVKRDDDAMTTTAAPEDTRITAAREYVQAGRHNAASVKYRLARAERAIANGNDPTAELDEIDKLIGFRPGETTIGVKTSSKGRTTTVTLPDGTVAERTSKTRSYTHAVVATRDLHQRAQQIQADTDRRQAFVDALQAWVDRGANTDELKAYPSRVQSYAERQAGQSPNEYYLPGFEPVRKSVRGGRDYWDDPMQFSLPNFKDTEREATYVRGTGRFDGPEMTAWEQYGPSFVLSTQRDHIAKQREQAANLEAGPRYAYEVIRWSSSRNLAAQAASSEFSNPWTTYRVIGVGDDLTGQTADESKPVKVKPTKAELDAAKAARAEQEKAERAKRSEEWTARKVADIKRHLAEGSEQRARSAVISTNDQGLRMIARAFGIKSTPRGMGDRQKTEWLRNAILEAAKKS